MEINNKMHGEILRGRIHYGRVIGHSHADVRRVELQPLPRDHCPLTLRRKSAGNAPGQAAGEWAFLP